MLRAVWLFLFFVGVALSWVCVPASRAVPAVSDVVMYEVNLRSFSPAGDLAGVSARLDDIQTLGANVIWLMPIHPVGQERKKGELGSPYSVMDYGQVSTEYGALSDLTALIDGAHQRGMYVILDWVANHTAWDHDWITDHSDWYTQNGQGEIIHPAGTNWTDVADLNYGSTAMRAAMIDEMRYWVQDVGVDGFRADAADWVPFSFWRDAVPAVRASTSRPLLMLAEGTRRNHYDAGFDLTFGWQFYGTAKSVFAGGAPASALGQANASAFSSVPDGKGILRFTTNHDETAWDEPPPVVFGSLEASLAAYAATVAYGGTPLVYASQEIGWDQNVPFFSRSPLDWSTGQDVEEWYATLLGVRADHASLRQGSFDDHSTDDAVVLRRQHGDEEVVVLINTRDAVVSAPIPFALRGAWADLMTGAFQVLGETVWLEPHATLFLAPALVSAAGDFNGNGLVEQGDLNLVLGNWGSDVSVAGVPAGWVNQTLGLGMIDQGELNYVLSNWGSLTAPVFGGSDLPEPAAVACLAGLALRTRRQHR